MFLIFGFGKRTTKEMGQAGKQHCSNCSNVREWNYKKVTTWFTLFFIPVIPYKVEYVKECPICHIAIKVEKDQIDGNGCKTSSNDENDGLTDVQRNYREQMEALKKE